MIQPPTGQVTLNELHEAGHPESYTIGRLTVAVTHQGCNPWTILRILYDYYNEMCARSPGNEYWIMRRDELLETEKKWAKQFGKVS